MYRAVNFPYDFEEHFSKVEKRVVELETVNSSIPHKTLFEFSAKSQVVHSSRCENEVISRPGFHYKRGDRHCQVECIQGLGIRRVSDWKGREETNRGRDAKGRQGVSKMFSDNFFFLGGGFPLLCAFLHPRDPGFIPARYSAPIPSA